MTELTKKSRMIGPRSLMTIPRIITILCNLFFISQAFFTASQALADSQVSAKRNKVKVFSEATKKSKVIMTLKKGDSLDSGERRGMFWEVKTKKGDKGFVSVLAVKRKADKSKGSLNQAIRAVVKGGRATDDVAGARSRSAVMGVRGLAEDDEKDDAGAVRPNLRAVYAMEDLFIKEARLEDFGEKVFREIESKSKRMDR